MPEEQPASLYHSVQLKHSQLTPEMLQKVLSATTQGISIADPDIYIMVRVQDGLTDTENSNTAIPVMKTIGQVQFSVASSKGNPPGTKSL